MGEQDVADQQGAFCVAGARGGARPTESSLQFSLYLHSTGPCRRGSPRRLGKVFMGLTWKSVPSRNLPAFSRFVCSAYDDANPPAALRSVGVSKPHVPSGARVTLCIHWHVGEPRARGGPDRTCCLRILLPW